MDFMTANRSLAFLKNNHSLHHYVLMTCSLMRKGLCPWQSIIPNFCDDGLSSYFLQDKIYPSLANPVL
jgi:hypothetical protein